MKETRRKRLLVLVDGSEYEEFEYLKSIKGKLFDLFLMNHQFTKIFQTAETRRGHRWFQHGSFVRAAGLKLPWKCS